MKFKKATAGLLSVAFLWTSGRPAFAATVDSSGLSADQRRRVLALTSVFESGSDVLNYGMIEGDMEEGTGDGRGLCGGLLGFCSGTADLLEVVKAYTVSRPDNPLAQKYGARLVELAQSGSDSVRGLEGFTKIWNDLLKDPVQGPLLRKANDDVGRTMYFDPAMDNAREFGIRSALGKAILCDTAVQHGVDGSREIIKEANRKMGGSPKSGIVGEKEWLRAFLKIRRGILAYAPDPKTRAVWAESVSRVDALKALLDEGNFDLDGPLHLKSQDFTNTIP